jgi:hypothetical protein
MSRCWAKVLKTDMIQHRASRDPDPRCQRYAQTVVMGAFGPQLLCRPHARIYIRHNELVDRILNIRQGDIQ